MAGQRSLQRQADRASGGPSHHLGADHEPGVVIDAGDHLHLRPIGQVDPAHHVHLPQLHRPTPLPPPIVAAAPLTLGRIQQPVPDQRPIHTRPARHRHDALPGQPIADPVRSPVPVLPPQPDHPHLHRRGHLMRTRPRPGRPVDQVRQPTITGIPGPPPVHRLPGHPIPAGHHRHRRPVQNLEDRPMPLLGHTQLHQHDRLPPPSPRTATAKKPTHKRSRTRGQGVTHLPEHLSHTYRNRVPKLSPSNRNPSDHHEPETHKHSGTRVARRVQGRIRRILAAPRLVADKLRLLLGAGEGV